MQLGYAIIYVADVPATLEHYEKAFGCRTAMLHESQQYGELDTGNTVLAFADHRMAKANGVAIRPSDPDGIAHGYEIVFVTDDVEGAYARALDHGASPVKPPETKPWTQVVGYVRDMNGVLVEIASPMLPQHRQ